ncbi:MAG: ATP-binding protein [Chloroflexi bacterium]|nr:ATP-binding protein [Chloroflexota bacterium]
MAKRKDNIAVTSHVSRDFLQNSTYFNTPEKIVWEYVSNSLDAARVGEIATVIVDIKPDLIVVQDNGQGMSREDLRNFFQMHGENLHRRKGKKVRGMFGTGKCAAFGLAKTLTMNTVQSGLKNIVRLTLSDIQKATHGKAFPVQEVQINGVTNEEDGTRIEIKDFKSRKKIRVEKTISYVERHLSRYRGRAQVKINGHECKSDELPYTGEPIIRQPPPHLKQHTGDVRLMIKKSPIPLESERNGIDILSNGNWHETTLAGIEDKECAKFLFGEVDVPVFEDTEWEIPPFDNTRSVRLNDQNPVVSMLLGWIAEELELVRLELVEAEREKRESEQAKRLAREAERIARILNDDFAEQEMELEIAKRVKSRVGTQEVLETLNEDGEVIPDDGDLPGHLQEAGNPHGNGSGGNSASEGNEPRPGPSLIDGNELGSRKKTEQGRSKRRRSVFSIEYEEASQSRPRSRYNAMEKTIYINLDHLQISKALEASKNNIYGKQFREMCYEVAAVEYALAFGYERVEKDDVREPADALYEVRETIDRITNRLATILYERD